MGVEKKKKNWTTAIDKQIKAMSATTILSLEATRLSRLETAR